jgi:hypothetical protein
MGKLAIFAAQILRLTLRKRLPTARRSEQAFGKLSKQATCLPLQLCG